MKKHHFITTSVELSDHIACANFRQSNIMLVVSIIFIYFSWLHSCY